MTLAPALATEPAYLAVLNPEQREAVLATEGAVLVLAGAGTGKTRVLTTRIAHILASRLAYSGQILAVTFTNKAAREMGERIAQLFHRDAGENSSPTQSSGLHWLGTFHSIAAKILRRHAELLGFSSQFTILDTDDQLRLLKQLMAELGMDDKATPAKQMLAVISGFKDQGLTPDAVTSGDMVVRRLYQTYQARLKLLNAVDFGDLLLHNLTLFRQFPDILNEYAGRFRYILVDEYQDTNIAQYLWLRLLVLGHKNICCVGDDDQSIYGWRGAEVGNILKFEKDFTGAKIIRLERNYRSTQHILGAASHLIAFNRSRLGKTLWTEQADSTAAQVKLKSNWDEEEEARFIGEEIELLQHRGTKISDIAILVRAGFQTRAFEERFITLGIPYRVVGGLRFYERQEIKDVVAYLRVLFQPDDDLAFERIINTPKRGIGKTTVDTIHQTARAMNLSLSRTLEAMLAPAISNAPATLRGKTAQSLSRFLGDISRWRKQLAVMTLSELTETLIEESGYREMWLAEKTPDAQGRLENLRELVRALTKFETLAEFIEHVGLVSELAEGMVDEMVTLMTLHAAKGLEFDTVFLPGWEEGLFPHQRALDESGDKGLEEERRLAYVGITRARRNLYISHAANRRIYNQWQSSIPSRFIAELPAPHIDNLGGGNYGTRGSFSALRQEMEGVLKQANERRKTIVPPPAKTTATAQPPSPFAQGKRIFHVKFGYGTITHSEGKHLDIAFDSSGSKKVLADYVVPAEKAG